jgi:hypothetical protein
VKRESDLKAYVRAVYQLPMVIVFALLDAAAVVTIFVIVVDDAWEGLIAFAFILVVHVGNFLIFSGQRSEIARREEQIAKLKARQPRLDLSFLHDGEAFRRMKLYVDKLPEEPGLEELVQREAEELEGVYREAEERENTAAPSAVADILRVAMGRRLRGRDKYDEECGEYLKRYRRYLFDRQVREVSLARMRRLGFELANKGSVPADDIVVLIRVPDQFRFPTEEEELLELQLKFDEPPKRPAVFQSSFASLGQLSHLRDISIPSSFGLSDGGPKNIRGPFLEDENGPRVRYEVDKLLHGFHAELTPVELVVSEEAIGDEWELRFEIHARQLHDSISGSLLVGIDVG